jgi:hypothetical protein
MFLVTNFYFRPYEFLRSSLSFLGNTASIPRIEKCHLGMVKIVSVLLSMFTSENEVEKRILARQLSVPPCIAHYQAPFERNHNTLILCEKTCFSCPILVSCACMSLIYSQ